MGALRLLVNLMGFLEDSLLLFADEMTRITGARVQQTLKALITGEELLLESKGIDVKHTKLMARLIIASNDYAVIRGERTSRRYLSLEVSNKYINNHTYFNRLFEECSNSMFLEDLMYYLENRHLDTGAYLRKAPVTSLLERQKVTNILERNNIILWLFLGIDSQTLGVIDLVDASITMHEWALNVNRVDLRKEYESWCMSVRKNPISPISFYGVLREVGFRDTKIKKHGRVYRAMTVPSINDISQSISKYIGVNWESLDNVIGNS